MKNFNTKNFSMEEAVKVKRWKMNHTQEEYAKVIRLLKASKCDFTHCARVLKDVNWNEEKALEQIREEVKLFSEGKIKFNLKKEII